MSRKVYQRLETVLFVSVASQIMPEALSVISIILMTNAQRFVQLHFAYKSAIRRCMPTDTNAEALPDHHFSLC